MKYISFYSDVSLRVRQSVDRLDGGIRTWDVGGSRHIKNTIFCIAKQQELDGGTGPFYLFWTGDDRLEVLFGWVRMQGGYNPNFCLKELVERLAAAVDLEGVFSRHQTWERGHQYLKVTRTEHADHLNLESWNGDITANSVDLPSAWYEGQVAAQH